MLCDCVTRGWYLLFVLIRQVAAGERRLLLSWAKAGKDSKESREATRSEGDDLEKSAARALMHLYIVYWNSYSVFNDYRQLRIPLPLIF